MRAAANIITSINDLMERILDAHTAAVRGEKRGSSNILVGSLHACPAESKTCIERSHPSIIAGQEDLVETKQDNRGEEK